MTADAPQNCTPYAKLEAPPWQLKYHIAQKHFMSQRMGHNAENFVKGYDAMFFDNMALPANTLQIGRRYPIKLALERASQGADRYRLRTGRASSLRSPTAQSAPQHKQRHSTSSVTSAQAPHNFAVAQPVSSSATV